MKIIAGGVGKAQVAAALKPLLRPQDSVIVSSDMDAAMKLRAGTADYYLGTCHTGAGASLGVQVGLLGGDKCHTFGRAIPAAAEVATQLAAGKKAYGFSVDQINDAAPVIWAELLKREGN